MAAQQLERTSMGSFVMALAFAAKKTEITEAASLAHANSPSFDAASDIEALLVPLVASTSEMATYMAKA